MFKIYETLTFLCLATIANGFFHYYEDGGMINTELQKNINL